MSEKNSRDDVDFLKRRLSREKKARKQAETLLSEKSNELYDALQDSKQTESRLKLALWAAQESFWEWNAKDDQFAIRAFSYKSIKEFHWSSNTFSLLRHVHEEDISNLEFQWALVLHCDQDRLELSFRYRIKGQFLWMRLRGRVLERDGNGSAIRIVGTIRDITHEREAEQSFHLMASAFASSKEPMLVLSNDLKITECNNAGQRLLSLKDKTTCFGWALFDVLDESSDKLTQLQDKEVRFETNLTLAGGRKLPVDVALAKFENRYQNKPYIIATLRDISDRKMSESLLRQLAMHDELTGLFNRTGLNDVLDKYLSGEQKFSLMFIDLDGFKQINDGAGHELGDLCLRRVAKIMEQVPVIDKIVTRWGGDEFVIVLPSCDVKRAEKIGLSVIEGIENLKIESQSTELRLSASIGIASFPCHGQSVERLIQNADAAMYQAKIHGKGCVNIYEQGLWESMKAQVSLLADLRKTIEHDQLDFFIQGKYDIHGTLKCGELLCRWHSALHGNISPGVFIPLAETHRLDFSIGLQALHRACEYIKVMDEEREPVQLAVNISANQLLDPGFPSQAVAICREHNVAAKNIEIELTESIFMQNEEQAIAALNTLRRYGFALALDDFGSGFSALSYLCMFSFSTIKLDRSLLKDIHRDEKALALFQGIIAMLRRLKMHTVVEGVELSEYLPVLREARVDLLQGFYFDKPAPFGQFMARLPLRGII
ncbi:EAL domain-containing protein [Alteromonas sp. C1M14]|uniref:putative bifunctional diguanylate cyclase/phosphodiesterase n=1 Tax=Alteromonas sp. C1M14 TaxID=2841567 RepID=UPI00339D8937